MTKPTILKKLISNGNTKERAKEILKEMLELSDDGQSSALYYWRVTRNDSAIVE